MDSFLALEHLTKTFGGTTALDDVSLSFEQGECHALMGENGAGKSTLGKIISGIHRPDRGVIRLDGHAVRFSSPREAGASGIAMVHQELAFCPDLSVAENLNLGHYPRKFGFFLDHGAMKKRAAALLAEIGVEIELHRTMKDLSIAQQQLVQIAAAVGSGARVLVFDEPTSSLSESEAKRLFELIRKLRERGVTIMYVSHRMGEVFDIADKISVLRDGRFVGTMPRKEASPDAIVGMMIGRQMEEYFPHHLDHKPGEEILSVEHLSSPGKFHDVSFSVRRGEIVGFAGLVGSGRSEIAKAVFGLDRRARGRIALKGKDISAASLRRRMRGGVALVPEDRKKEGLALILSCRVNFSLTILDLLSRFIFLRRKLENERLHYFFDKLAIKAASVDSAASSLSGGNQQKIVLAKWLARDAALLMLDEPTRGVDIGAKAAIHTLVDNLARQGLGIILISSELPEVLNLSTRILVMREGKLVREVPRASATQDHIMRLMAGLSVSGPNGER